MMNVYLILGSARKIQLNKQKFVYTKFHGKISIFTCTVKEKKFSRVLFNVYIISIFSSLHVSCAA